MNRAESESCCTGVCNKKKERMMMKKTSIRESKVECVQMRCCEAVVKIVKATTTTSRLLMLTWSEKAGFGERQ